jgi:hypothetical protein
MVARAKQAAARRIPDGEGEIAEQPFDASLAPGVVSVQDEFRVGDSLWYFAPGGPQAAGEVGAAINAGVGGEPDLAVQRTRLAFVLRFGGGAKHGVAETDVMAVPDGLLVGAAKGHEIRQPPQQLRRDGLLVEIYEADNSAHAIPSGLPAHIGR